jgi:hypothetical protein
MFSGAMVGLCIASAIFLFLTLAISLRLFPRFLSALRRLIWGVIVVSYRLYVLVFDLVTQGRFQHHEVDNQLIAGRMLGCAVLSLLIGSGIILLLHWPLNLIWIVLFILHGLFIGLFWDEIPNAGGFRLGERIE